MIFKRIISRHKNRVLRLQNNFGISDYLVFWMGFGEGALIGGVIVFIVLKRFF
tara:strand:+ start:285 stop:443 length:159 start_codon:yes stop_codon:yes gene_type:complete